MGNSSESPKNCKIVYGAMIAKDENTIEMPPKNSNSISASSILLNGEMDINMEGNAFILDDKGNVVARIDNKNPRILVSKNLNEEKSIEAVNKYMKEKGLKTIAEVIKESAKEKEDTKTSSEMEI